MTSPIEVIINAASGSVEREETRHWLTDLFAANGVEANIHLHVSRITHTAERYKLVSGRSALVIQAGTATSTRGRGEANSFNVIEFEHPRLIVKRLECKSAKNGFIQAESQEFLQTEKGWSSISEN